MNILKQTKAYGVRTAIVITTMKIAGGFAMATVAAVYLGGVFAPASEVNQPLNAPSYDSPTHRVAAAQLCEVETGTAGLVRASGEVVAAHVIVVRNNGVMQRMDTTEAWDRSKSKTEADDIWVVGVCKADAR